MSTTAPTLYMICGKIAAGKSTLADALEARPATLRLDEDVWLSALYGEEMQTPADFVQCAAKLRTAMERHVISLLQAGLSVVLDFQANTVDSRAWMRRIFEAAGAAHELHVLDASDATCLARLHARNARGAHAFAATDAQFYRVTQHFVAPTQAEGFNIIRHAVAE